MVVKFYSQKNFLFSGGGFGIHVVGGKEIPGTNGEIGAYIANLAPAGTAELSGKVIEGKILTI